ncbi:MAG: KH domain-containing protein [Chlamydiae bacterium]|jgi:predicted RNA-binding protein YlqC (UPF0109 family)|nr:KH domain-containing protein [Chlamydiota bacterium]
MKEFVEYLIKNLVSDPTGVNVKMLDQENRWTIQICVTSQDVAKVIGRQGRTIQALRTLAVSIGARLGRKVVITLVNELT